MWKEFLGDRLDRGEIADVLKDINRRSIGRSRRATTRRRISTWTSSRVQTPGRRSVSLMAGQQDDIGFADSMLMAGGRGQGHEVAQNGAWAVISLAESPIRTPQELSLAGR